MVIALFVCAALGILSLALAHQIKIAKKANQIRVYPLPLGLVRSARDAPDSVLPELSAAEQALLLEALRQFFRARLKAGEKKITVPSRAVQSVWVAFSRQTQAYEAFCDRFFGRRFPTEQAFALGSDAGPTYYFGTDFSDRSIDGTLDGLGNSSDSGGDGGGDGGGGD